MAAVSAVLLGCCVGFLGHWRAWNSVRENDPFKQALGSASEIERQAADYDNKYKESKAEFAKVKVIGDRLESIGYRRLMWPEVMRAISESLPHDADSQRSTENLKPEQLRDMLLASKRIEIDSLDCEHYPKLEDWFADVRKKWLEGEPEAATTSGVPAAPATAMPGAARRRAARPAARSAGGWSTGPRRDADRRRFHLAERREQSRRGSCQSGRRPDRRRLGDPDHGTPLSQQFARQRRHRYMCAAP